MSDTKWWRCALVDTDPPNTRTALGTFSAKTREDAEKKCRATYKRMFDRLSTNKIQLEAIEAQEPGIGARPTITDPQPLTRQIFTREMAP